MARWNSDTLRNFVQTTAILAAGTWAVMEFVINEERLTFKLNTAVSAELGPLIPAKGEVPPFKPVSFSIQLHNVGEDPGQIVLAALSVSGNINGTHPDLPMPYRAHDAGANADFAFINWAADRDDLSFNFFAPSLYVRAGETIGDAPVVLVANPEDYDSLSYFLIVWAMESCVDFTSDHCPSVSLAVDGSVGIECEVFSDHDIGGDYCGQFYLRRGDQDPEPVSLAVLANDYELTAYTYEGLLVLPPAPAPDAEAAPRP